ncbi:bifunctional 2-polyprenyl-6-hydroxyphenol methylase/3-demethylubiquinol 3-O-methyltransferase UbiG [Sphingomonas sp. IW22]|uniref:bifunctional 2-polyprenyl-6-hydroxyphenol methylase/3-demethylubiquinol 3-O-methyltransferase UbiG n=1 Tax=Sphingomonas sp. IW22 TaxID=3242489 RepID=UPI003522ADDB
MAKATTIDPTEAAHFGKLAEDWWNPRGTSAMLHRLNPVRLRYIRQAIDAHWQLDPGNFAPLWGRSALDVGCGAGLLTEPLARMGARTTGVDAAPENVGAAAAHAAQVDLDIRYVAGELNQLCDERFDLVTSMEVIEHVTDPATFVRGLAGALAPGGLLVMSTPNRTPMSKLALIDLAERVGMIPRGTHQWDKFLTPDELSDLMRDAGLLVINVTGLAYSPSRGFSLSEDQRLNYLISAVAG